MGIVNIYFTIFEIIYMNDAEKIKKIRNITGLNGSDFGKKIGVGGSSTISNYEKGVTPVSKTVWLAIEHIFGYLYEIRKDQQDNEHIVPKMPILNEERASYSITPGYGENQVWHDMLEEILTGNNQKNTSAIMTNIRAFHHDKDAEVEGYNDEIDLFRKKIAKQVNEKKTLPIKKTFNSS